MEREEFSDSRFTLWSPKGERAGSKMFGQALPDSPMKNRWENSEKRGQMGEPDFRSSDPWGTQQMDIKATWLPKQDLHKDDANRCTKQRGEISWDPNPRQRTKATKEC